MPNTGDIVKASDFQAIKPQLSIGTVTTGAAGTNASASITGTSPNFKLNLTIPRGANGTNGQSGVLGTQVFTSSTTVTVPTGATKAILSGCGGGGGSCGRAYGLNATRWVNYCGGNGGHVINYIVSVTQGASIVITIGKGGSLGGTVSSSNRTASSGTGGVTSFGSLLSLGGGSGVYVADSASRSATNGSSPINITNTFWGTRVDSASNSSSVSTGYGVGGRGIQGDLTMSGQAGGQGILIVTWAR